MASNTGNRGYTYPTLGDSNDVPFYMQTLAEQIDGDVHQIKTSVFTNVGFTYSGAFNSTSSSTTHITLPLMNVTFVAIAGHRYRLTFGLVTSGSATADVAALTVHINGTQIASYATGANSSPTTANTGQAQQFSAFWTAPSSGPFTASIEAFRAAGSGTVSFSSSATSPATHLVEDMGVA